MDFDILKGFIDTEIIGVNTPEHQGMYDAIRYFLTCLEIREGKFEANEYLLNKLNRDTVIIYQEYQTEPKYKYSQAARICEIKDLVKLIDKEAKKIGLKVQKE